MSKIAMSARFFVSFLLLLLCWSQPVASQDLPDPRQKDLSATARLEALLERVRNAQGQIESMEATFTQIKMSEMLLAPDEATGVFSYSAPDKVRWEYLTPNPISLLIRDDVMTTWYRDIGQAERVKVGKQSQKILQYLGAGSSLDDLLQYFIVSMTVPEDREKPYRLDLAPKFDKVAKRIQGMSLWVDATSYLPVQLQYIEPDGDSTEYFFAGYDLNGDIPEDRFELVLPASVDVRVVELGQRAGS